jgi:hypothetical protein
MRSLLLVESFELRPSDKYVLLIPGCFLFVKMCLCQVSLLSRCSQRYLTSSWGSCALSIWTGAHCFSCGECDMHRLVSVRYHYPFLNRFWIANRLVYRFCEAMTGSLSAASTAVSSAEVAVVESGEVGRCLVQYLAVRPHWLGRVLCTQFKPLRGSVCYANRILGQGNN